MRSPIPESPIKVSMRPPIFTPRRLISVIPLVISAARVLSPKPMPSITPAASAITFLIEPPSSIPIISELVYTRNLSFINISWIISADSRFTEPATTVVGTPIATSSAWLGPDSTEISACGISDRMTSRSVQRVSFSMPFATLTIRCPSRIYGDAFFAVCRTNGDATAKTSRSYPVHASFKSFVSAIESGSFTPGSLSLCSLCSASISISASTADHNVTSCPFFANIIARAVPQLPAPRKLTLLIVLHSFLDPYASFLLPQSGFSLPWISRTMFLRCWKYARAVKIRLKIIICTK